MKNIVLALVICLVLAAIGFFAFNKNPSLTIKQGLDLTGSYQKCFEYLSPSIEGKNPVITDASKDGSWVRLSIQSTINGSEKIKSYQCYANANGDVDDRQTKSAAATRAELEKQFPTTDQSVDPVTDCINSSIKYAKDTGNYPSLPLREYKDRKVEDVVTELCNKSHQALDSLKTALSLFEWSYSAKPDAMSGEPRYIASIVSKNTVNFAFPYQGEQRASLTVREHKNDSDIMLSIQRGQVLCGATGCRALIRFDDAEAETVQASPPSDGSTEVIFIDYGYDEFIRKLLTAKILRVTADIYKEGSPVFEFDVNKFDVNKLRENK